MRRRAAARNVAFDTAIGSAKPATGQGPTVSGRRAGPLRIGPDVASLDIRMSEELPRQRDQPLCGDGIRRAGTRRGASVGEEGDEDLGVGAIPAGDRVPAGPGLAPLPGVLR